MFNHVGTDFPRYRDPESAHWFSGDNFEGHAELIALNHKDPAVADYVTEVMTHWLDRGADGWRLDAAYTMPQRFWAEVLPTVRSRYPDAWFVGELIHGDYAAVVDGAKFNSATQYELWKAIWSSLNDGNFFELDWALQRHNSFLESFVPQTFIGNHDVTRIASRLEHPAHPAHALVILLTTGGVPSIYAGDEFGFRGVKEERFGGDDVVRPEFPSPPMPLDECGADVWALHRYLVGLRRRHPWLHTARTSAVRLDNKHYVYESRNGRDALLVALNIDDKPLRVSLPKAGTAQAQLIAGSTAPPEEFVDTVEIEPHGWRILRP